MSKAALSLFLTIGVAILISVSLLACSATQTFTPETPPLPPETPDESLPVQEEQPAITQPPQPSKIAFIRDCGTNYRLDIFTINSDGSDERNITKNHSDDLWPSWSPDGTKIVFQSAREWHGFPSVYIMDISGENIRCLTPEITACQFPAWSPDGKTIAYSSAKLSPCGTKSLDIFVMDTNGNNKKAVAPTPKIFNSPSAPQVCASWFPDSKRIAFTSNYAGWWEIYTMNIDGTKRQKYDVHIGVSYGLGSLPSTGATYPAIIQVNTFPTLAVSPDGTSIAFDYRSPVGRRDIYILSLADGNLRNLTEYLRGNSYSPTWSPDGTKIAFTFEVNKKTDIYIIEADGNNPTLLIKNGSFPMWQRQ